MQYGTVNDALEATVSLIILKDEGTDETFEFIVDTGLTEEMVLPQHVIDHLDLPLNDTAMLATGDGRVGFFATYTVRILWHDQPREVHVASMGGEFLIGMDLLRGSNLSVDAVPGGSVTITELVAAGP